MTQVSMDEAKRRVEEWRRGRWTSRARVGAAPEGAASAHGTVRTGHVYGSSSKLDPNLQTEPMREFLIGYCFLPQRFDKPGIGECHVKRAAVR